MILRHFNIFEKSIDCNVNENLEVDQYEANWLAKARIINAYKKLSDKPSMIDVSGIFQNVRKIDQKWH